MIKIGVFARMGQVSIKTLRHYDDIGLLLPDYVDDWSGYRYYTLEQLPRLHRILALKDLGLSLEEIARLLKRNPGAAEMRQLLCRKQAELAQRVAEEQARLERVEVRLRQLNLEGKMSDYEVIVKRVEPMLVAAIRETIPDWEQVSPTFNRLFDEVFSYAASQNAKFAGPGLDLWHEESPGGRDMPVEAAAPIEEPIPESDRVKVTTLPGVETMAATIHLGDFAAIGQAHQAVARWAGDNGYTLSGPSREIYLQYERAGDPKKYVTEIQYPIARA